MYLAFSCAIIQGFRQTRASKIRILWRACGFFVYFKIQVKSNASGSCDGYVAFSGAIPSKISNKKLTRRSREFECIRILWRVCHFFMCGKINVLDLRASKIRILCRVCRFFRCNTILFFLILKYLRFEQIRILWAACRFFMCKNHVFRQTIKPKFESCHRRGTSNSTRLCFSHSA